MSKLLQELSDVSNIANITEVKFGLLNPEALKKASVCHVTIPETYDGNEPKENGLFDPRMGVLERGRICPTDDYDHTICPGYFGHIELPLPVYWIQHMDTIIKLLRCVCIRCANLLIDKSNPIIMKELKKKNGANAFKYVADLCTKQSSKKCIYNGGCNAVQPTIYRKVMGDKYKNDNIIQIDAEYSSDAFKDANEKKLKFMLPVEHVLNIFKKITNEDAELLGFDVLDSRPEWMICTVVPVAPPAVRPSVRQDNNQRAEDDLTSKIAEIVKNVNLLKKELEKALKKESDVEKESSARQINLVHNMIQYHVATMVDNEIKNIPVSSRRSGQPLKMIRQRLKGKEGRIRSNIMGKRVDFSGRTVVGVDPSISIDEYGVPMKIAMNLTIPEIVTKYNKAKLYRLVRTGPLVHPGAKQITKMNYDENGIAHPEHIYLKYIDRESVVLEDGDVVERHLMDGDWGQFNRQPSLHRMSMMAHKVKVMPGKTFRLNVYCTAPYNADFDGDEMNTHIPQNIQTAYELEKLTAVPTQIISPAKSEPIIQVNFDTMVAAFLITHPHVKISRKNAFNLTMTNNQFTGKMPSPDKDGNWRGQDIYSMFLPDISFSKENKSYDVDPSENNKVIIENGVFKQGILDKTIIGKTLIHMIYDSFGSEAVKNFLDNNQRMLNRWLSEHCFTLGMGDCIPTSDDNKKINEIIEGKIKNVNTIIKEANVGIYNPNLDSKFIHISLESDIKEQLDGAKYDFEKYLKKNIDRKNGMYITNSSGAKGDVLSAICQTRGFLGQTSIIDKRVAFGYDRRTLPHFSKNDYGAISRGFIVNNFFNGLDPHELFFHQMGGRVGVIDTAIKSVSYDTTIVILENGEIKYVQIGEWIDKHLDENKNEIENLPEKEQELLKLKDGAYISTTDDDGNVSWGEVTAITRHDPGKEMYKIYTESGRDVKVVESKSLIVWNEELKKFIEKPTPEIKVGDYLPLTMNLECPPIVNSENILSSSNEKISEYLSSFNEAGCDIFKIPNYEKTLPYLFSRIGVFTEIDGDELTVYWNQIPNYRIVNDVILDSIVKIDKLSVLDYPKVYDITVPKTLNFGLSNGLQVRDTAESGYMQRRLIKALEDLSVKYGGTVRNGVNNIVQFAYGDDGIDPCKLNKQELKLIEYSNEEMAKKYLITEESMALLKNIMTVEAYKEMTSHKDYITNLKGDYDKIMGIRDIARKSYFKNMSVMNAPVFSPVFFPRTIKNARDMFKNQLSKKTDLTPTYIRTLLKELEVELSRYLPDFSLNIFRALLYSNLSTKVSIIENKFNKVVFKFVIDTIREKYITSFVQPGEMVGIIGAQSMGEPLTQMSVPAETRIVVEMNGLMLNTTIGEFVDRTIKNKNGSISVDESGRHTIMEVRDKMKILSVSPDEKIGWREISKVSRHPVNGKLMCVKTRTGRSTRATLSHSFLKRSVNGIVPIEGSKLAVGDRIPVCMNLPEADSSIEALSICGMKITCDELFGIFCAISSYNYKQNKLGYAINLYGNEIDIYMINFLEQNGISYEKRESVIIVKSVELSVFINEKFVKNFSYVYQMPLDFISGYLECILHFHGVVQVSRKQVVITMDCDRLIDIQNLMNYFGVFGYFTEDSIIITKKYIQKLSEEFNIFNNQKKEQIKLILETQKDTRECVDYVDKIPAVGELVAEIGKRLNISGNSRIYGRWKDVESIGRKTLEKYLNDFKVAMDRNDDEELKLKVGLIEQAVYSDVIWDEIISIDYYEGDELEYVYDFTVPNAESFMVDSGIMVHNTLNTFHNAGVGAKALVTSTGVPRIKEIINVSKTIKSPSMEIYLKDEYSTDIAGAKYVCNYIGFTKLQDIVEKTMIIYENSMDETNIEEDIEYIRTYQEFAEAIGITICPTEQTSNWILRVVFNKEKMMDKNIYLSDIQDVIQRNSVEDDIICIFSDDNAKELMMRIRIREDSHDGDYLEFLQELEKILMGITIRGVPNIEQVIPNMRKKIVYREDGSYNQTTEWYLETSGVNLLDVFTKMNDKIDSNRTLSNDIHEINEIFGIEATRSIIIRELMKMQDYEVNYRHLSLLGDIMTHRGIIMPIERHGINRSGERGAIAKATFEESTEILVKASTFAEKDKMGGVSANIMFGQLPRVGTNAFDILFDEVKFFNELKKMKIEGKKYEEKVDIKENIEEKLLKEYDENLGDSVDNMFNFSVDATKLNEKPMKPHIIPEIGLNNGPADSKKKKISMKKKD